MVKRKKGVSPVVSTVLLIMIVVILAIIILLWVSSFIKEAITKKIGEKTKTVEDWCKEIQISPEKNSDGTSFGFTNNGNVPIYKYDLKLTKGGDSQTISIDQSVNPGYLSIINTEDKNLENYGDYEKIKIIPVLLGKGTKSSGQVEFKCPESERFVI